MNLDGIDKIVVIIVSVVIADFFVISFDRARPAPGANLSDDIEAYENEDNANNQCPENDFANSSTDTSAEIEPRHNSLKQEGTTSNDSGLFGLPITFTELDKGKHNGCQSTKGDKDFEQCKDKEACTVSKTEVLHDDIKGTHQRLKESTHHGADAIDEHRDTQEYQQDSCTYAELDQLDVGFDRLTLLSELAIFILLLTSIVPHEVVQSGDVLELADDGFSDLLAAEPHNRKQDDQGYLNDGRKDSEVSEVYHEAQDEGQRCPQKLQKFHVIPHFLSTQGGRGSTWLKCEHIRSAPATYTIIISKFT